MPDNFLLYSEYYNLLYKDKDYNSEIEYVLKNLKKYFPEAKSILEFGSGTGIHGLNLKKRGYDVLGIERSEGMVDQARKNGLNCLVANIQDFKLKDKFDSIIALFHVISYLNSNDDLIKCFINAHNHLNDRGVFIFDVWYSPAVYHLKASPRIKRMNDENTEIIRFAEPVNEVNKNIIDVRFDIMVKDLRKKEVKEISESHPMRHFSIPEIGILAELSGFKILKTEEFLSGNEPSENTWGVCFILQKI